LRRAKAWHWEYAQKFVFSMRRFITVPSARNSAKTYIIGYWQETVLNKGVWNKILWSELVKWYDGLSDLKNSFFTGE